MLITNRWLLAPGNVYVDIHESIYRQLSRFAAIFRRAPPPPKFMSGAMRERIRGDARAKGAQHGLVRDAPQRDDRRQIGWKADRRAPDSYGKFRFPPA